MGLAVLPAITPWLGFLESRSREYFLHGLDLETIDRATRMGAVESADHPALPRSRLYCAAHTIREILKRF